MITLVALGEHKPHTLGRWGEEFARNFLRAQGYTILESNERTDYGEIDIIATKEGTLVFIEVKTRRNQDFGGPEGAIDARKREHLRRAAAAWIVAHDLEDPRYRIDLVAVEVDDNGDILDVRHYENAIGE